MMDREGYRELLRSRKVSEQKIDEAISIAERFENYLASPRKTPVAASTWEFCAMLIAEKQNTYDNLLALARYGRFIKNNDIYVAILELLDGAEVQGNLYDKVGSLFGNNLRDEAFAGIGLSPLGLPASEKPYDMFPVIDRLISLLGYDQVELLLSACLRDLPDEYFQQNREMFLTARDIDEYLLRKHQALINELKKCQDEDVLFFAQEITNEVVRYVQEHPETESGVRHGNILFITKIPFNARKYLIETDPILKRFYACHCPWARYAIKKGDIQLNPVFCNCSGGFSKKPWEVIFGQTLHVEVLESALKGDNRCRFAVHLPDNLEIR